MRYRTSKCPYCGYVLEYRSPSAKSTIGPPELPCPNCNRYYATGMKFWKDIKLFNKVFYIIRQIITIPLWMFVFSFMISAISSVAFDCTEICSRWIERISFIALIILSIRREVILMNLTEEKYLKLIEKN